MKWTYNGLKMTGMISRAQKMTIRQYCDTAIEQISRGQMVDAFGTWDVSSQKRIENHNMIPKNNR